ncbi:MAG: MATE family efflux transporter [Blautia sp.]|nr:MATE family efflux transporter [Blautia sp.]
MCHGAILPKLVSFALPLMLSSVLQLLFNAVDIMVVGHFTGKEALAAVGSTTALINVYTTLFIGISLGTNVLAARKYAAGAYDEMYLTVHTSITVALLSGILMIFVGLFFSRASLLLMGTPDDVINHSVLYMRIYFAGMPFFMLYNYGASILRAVGDTRRPLIILTVSGIANALLNLLLVIVFHMGVAGVAIATVISQCISSLLVLRILVSTDAPYRLDFRKLCLDKNCLRQILQVGIPSGIQSCVISFSNVLLQSSVNSFGSAAMAGYTSANNLMGFLYMSVNSITQAAMSFTSQNLGARQFKRLDRILLDCLFLEFVVPFTLGGLGYLFGAQLLTIYTTDTAVIRAGLEVMSISFIPYFLCGFMDLFPGIMRGLGHAFVPMVLSLIGTVGTRVLWIFLYFPGHRTLHDLFLSYPISWFCTIVLQAVCYWFVRKSVLQKYQY